MRKTINRHFMEIYVDNEQNPRNYADAEKNINSDSVFYAEHVIVTIARSLIDNAKETGYPITQSKIDEELLRVGWMHEASIEAMKVAKNGWLETHFMTEHGIYIATNDLYGYAK